MNAPACSGFKVNVIGSGGGFIAQLRVSGGAHLLTTIAWGGTLIPHATPASAALAFGVTMLLAALG